MPDFPDLTILCLNTAFQPAFFVQEDTIYFA